LGLNDRELAAAQCDRNVGVSEVPDTRDQAGAAGAKDAAWSATRGAQAAWAQAMRAHELAPPDPGFRGRARPPYELRAGTGRRGPEELWARFDAAVDELNRAGAGDSLAAVVAAYAAVAEAAGALADALEAAGE
jgi:hypothetical protein